MSKQKKVDRPVAYARVLSLLVGAHFSAVFDRVSTAFDRQNLERNFLEDFCRLAEVRQKAEARHGDILEVEGAEKIHLEIPFPKLSNFSLFLKIPWKACWANSSVEGNRLCCLDQSDVIIL